MYELSSYISRWIAENKAVCLATVIETWGSSPRPIGTKMAFTNDPLIAGSVSAGCVEGAVIEAGIRAIKTNQPALLHYGVTDDTAFSVGLSCGGKIDVFVRRLDENLFHKLNSVISTFTPVALLSILQENSDLFGKEMLVTEDQILFGSFSKDLDGQAHQLARDLIPGQQSQNASLEFPGQQSLRVFVDVIEPPPVLVMVGGVHIAVTLSILAKALGFRTIVIDPRKNFASQERFPEVDLLIQEWPEEAFAKIPLNSNTSVAVLTHDPKIDDPALKIVLNSPVQYIGVLGSRKTHAERCKRLQADGFTPEQLARLHAPIGIDLGGKNPPDIALSVLAEIVMERNAHIKSRKVSL